MRSLGTHWGQTRLQRLSPKKQVYQGTRSMELEGVDTSFGPTGPSGSALAQRSLTAWEAPQLWAQLSLMWKVPECFYANPMDQNSCRCGMAESPGWAQTPLVHTSLGSEYGHVHRHLGEPGSVPVPTTPATSPEHGLIRPARGSFSRGSEPWFISMRCSGWT